jgi:hypothetical protein
MNDILVFITATINSGKTQCVKRSNPDIRRKDYLRGLRSWLTSGCKADILFCENSGADISDFREAASHSPFSGSVRCLSFSGNSGAEKFGKGYGEIEMLKYAFVACPDLSQYRYIVKASGRYEYFNAGDVINKISASTADLICDIHANLTYGDTRTAAFTPEIALKYIIPFQEELDENRGIIIEHLMARCLHRTIISGGSWAPLPCTPYCDGISGSWNTPQRSTALYRLKQDIKRRIAKWIYRV